MLWERGTMNMFLDIKQEREKVGQGDAYNRWMMKKLKVIGIIGWNTG